MYAAEPMFTKVFSPRKIVVLVFVVWGVLRRSADRIANWKVGRLLFAHVTIHIPDWELPDDNEP